MASQKRAVSALSIGLLIAAGVCDPLAARAVENDQAAAIRAQMQALRQEMNQRMDALQKRLDSISGSQQTASTQSAAPATNQNPTGKSQGVAATAAAGDDSAEVAGAGNTAARAVSPEQAGPSAPQGTGETGKAGSAAEAAKKLVKNSHVGGLFEVAYDAPFATNRETSKSARDTGGDISFNKFVLNAQGDAGKFNYDVDYRFYDGLQFVQHGWFGYNATDNDSIKAGLIQVPFGNMPYGYLAFYGGLPYFTGFNDNQSAGVVYSHAGTWDYSAAFFKDAQFGSSAEHYGANPVPGVDAFGQNRGSRAVNQGDVRVAYNVGQGTDYTTNVSLSAKGGELYNDVTHDAGTNWATALGLNGTYGRWQAMFQATVYDFNPENSRGINDDLVQLGSFGGTYLIPAEGQMYQASVGYTIPLDFGLLKSVTIADDYSILNTGNGIDYDFSPAYRDISNPQINDIGAYWLADPFFIWTDIVSAKNSVGFIDNPDGEWHHTALIRLGVNF